MAGFPLKFIIGVLCIYALASTPFIVYYGLSALFGLITALRSRADDATWLNPVSWVTPRGYTRAGYEELTGSAADLGKGVLGLVPWGVLLYLAGL